MVVTENVVERKDDNETKDVFDRKGDERKGGDEMNDASDTVRTERSFPPRNDSNKGDDTSSDGKTGSVRRRNDGKGSSAEGASPENDGQGTTVKAERRLILGDTALLAAFFRGLYGTEEWAALDVAPTYPSGPVPKSQGGLAMRRLADPVAKFYVAVTMAEAALLVRCVAHNADERDQLNLEIDGVLGLSTAVASGRIKGFTICWPNGRYPKTATKIRILAATGQRTRSQVLGTLDREIRRFVDAVMAPPYTMARIVNGRPAGQG